jgi:hypothetical protein
MGALHPRPPGVEEPPHRAATPRPSSKQMGRDTDTGPKMLYPGGYFDRRSAVGVRCDTMIFCDLCGASPWCGGGTPCPTLFRNYLRTGASTRRGLDTSAQRTARPRDRGAAPERYLLRDTFFLVSHYKMTGKCPLSSSRGHPDPTHRTRGIKYIVQKITNSGNEKCLRPHVRPYHV